MMIGAAVCIAGVGGYLLGRRQTRRRGVIALPAFDDKARKPEPEPEPVPNPPAQAVATQAPENENTAAETPALRLQAILRDLDTTFYDLAHPRDLLEQKAFADGVALLADRESFGPAELEGYVAGDSITAACLALRSLELRAEDHPEKVPEVARETVLRFLPGLSTFPLYYALRFLGATAVDQRSVAEVLLYVNEWWAGNALVVTILGEYLQEASKQHPGAPAFGDALNEPPSAMNVEAVAKVLDALNVNGRFDLRREFERFRRTQIDRGYLNGIGRIREARVQKNGIVAQPDWEPRLSALERQLRGKQPRSVLIVGDPGTGKSSFLELLLDRFSRSGWKIFIAGAQDVMAGQTYIGEIEKRVRELAGHLAVDRKIIWHVPDLMEMHYAARHRYNPVSLLEMFLPYVESGALIIVSEIRSGTYERLSRWKARVRTVFETVRLRTPDDAEAVALFRRWAEPQYGNLHSSFLKEAMQMARQYFSDQQAPGNLFTFMKMVLGRLERGRESNPGRAPGQDDLLQTLAGLTGLPVALLDERQSLDPEDLRELFLSRVVGQTEAVDCLVERVAMIKAGLTDPKRPYGVFLFVGPTGTGKTEIAKTLAEFLFGSADRLLRFDMSEFQSYDSLGRLVGEGGLEDANDPGDGSLVRKIRKQPFSVLLLDEFEKAHPNVWDLFLQVFDDGRLTDRQGVTADFRHSIIILTSNVGAVVSRGPGIGFESGSGGTLSVSGVEKGLSQTFRREFLNRIDRIVVFRPLSRAVMREILQKELRAVMGRRGLRHREWDLEWDDSALEFLLDRGFTPDLGARPLRRAVERYLLSPLAMTIARRQYPEGSQFLLIRGDSEGLQVDFIDPDRLESEDVEATDVPEDHRDLRGLVLQAAGTPEEAALLERTLQRLGQRASEDDWLAAKNELIERTNQADFWEYDDRYAVLSRIELFHRLEEALETAGSLYRRLTDRRPPYSPDLSRRLARLLYLLEQAQLARDEGLARDAFLLIEAVPDREGESSAAFSERLYRMYAGWAKLRRMRFAVLEEAPDVGRYVLAAAGFGAYRILQNESGLHVYESPSERRRVRLRVMPQPDHEAAGGTELLTEQAQRAFAQAYDEQEFARVVRRYREEPSPLVRDAVRGYRTGRVERVFEGNFDLVSE